MSVNYKEKIIFFSMEKIQFKHCMHVYINNTDSFQMLHPINKEALLTKTLTNYTKQYYYSLMQQQNVKKVYLTR